MCDKKDQGVIEVLCEEIGATYADEMDDVAVLVAFVKILVDEIDRMVLTDGHIQHLTGKFVPEGTDVALIRTQKVLSFTGRKALIHAAEQAHKKVDTHGYIPCNHYVDMLSSCLSAIRFGLEQPCRSRHAAEAASHVWKRKYGITLFDQYTGDWANQWATAKFKEALITLDN